MPRIAVISLAIVLTAAVLRAAPIDDLPAPIVTRQNLFSIPFTVPAVAAADQPVEVRLLASGDRGVTWQVADRVDIRRQPLPYKGGFTFRATADAEYWFAIRTVDRAGQMRTDKAGVPELRVVVDTRPPRLDFSAMRGAAGEIVVRWQSDDSNLKPDSLKLQYQSTANRQWQAIAIEPPSRGGAPTTVSHSATWWPADAAGLLTIKAEISDAAGNSTVAQSQVDLAPLESRPAGQAWDDRRPPNASINRASSDPRDPPTVNDGFSRGVPWNPDVRTDLPLGRGPSQDARTVPERNSPGGQSTGDNVGPIEGPALVAPVDSPMHPPVGNRFTAPSDDLRPRQESVRSAAGTADRESRPSAAASSPIYFQGGVSGTPSSEAAPRQPSPAQRFDFVLPPGEQLRMVNSTAFELDYEVELVGRSGIAKVELWMTRDGGRTWSNVGADADSRSPFRATVDGEGVYGFRLTVQSGSGLGGRPPQPGDLPEVWIGVDLTRPQARLISAEASSGDRAGEIAIRYEAVDALLANRPITLLQSVQPGGPWTTVAAGLGNTGQYVWRFDENVPERVYLRLEVRDEAGNIATFDASEPVVLQRFVPQGRLRDVRPVGVSS